jgi:hypothetical protein
MSARMTSDKPANPAGRPPMPYYRPPLDYRAWMTAWEARAFPPRRPEQLALDLSAPDRPAPPGKPGQDTRQAPPGYHGA